jgi:hypothetical protein
MRVPLVEYGVAKFILPGQVESGDHHLICSNPEGVLIAAIDGIGHGEEAANAAKAATSILKTYVDDRSCLSESATLRGPPSRSEGIRFEESVATDLIHAMRQVSRGEAYLSPDVSGAIMEAYRSKSEKPRDPLTAREKQVLQLIAEGKSTKDVASVLGISVKTGSPHQTHAEA